MAMSEIAAQPRRVRTARHHARLGFWAAGLALVWSAACGPEPSQGSDDEVVEVQSAVTNANNLASVVSTTKKIVKNAKTISEVYSGVHGAVDAIQVIATLLGLIDPPVNELAELSSRIDAYVTGISWGDARIALDQALAVLESEPVFIDMLHRQGLTYDTQVDSFRDTHTAVTFTESESAFRRVFVETVTDGTMPWKSYIAMRPAVTVDNSVYDWRIGVPFMLKAIALRLLIISAADGSFRTNHVFDSELTVHRNALRAQFANMFDKTSGGVQCGCREYIAGAYPSFPVPTIVMGVRTLCADIFTGVSSTITTFAPQFNFLGLPLPSTDKRCLTFTSNPAYKAAEEQNRYQVTSKMPAYEMQAMIDLLESYLQPGAELTDPSQTITLESAQGLCLEVAGGSSAPGTPIQVATCNASNAQRWKYNRKTGQIRHPGMDTCLDIQWANPASGTPIWSWPCSPPDGAFQQVENLAQQWSYDPVSKRIHSGLKPFLELAVSSLNSGATLSSVGADQLATAPFLAQWHANGLFVAPAAPTSCGVLNPGEGLTQSSKVYSCDGRFAFVMQADGNLALFQIFSGGAAQLWSNNTGSQGPTAAIVHEDGNFVTYYQHRAVWQSHTNGNPQSRLVVQNDGDVAIFDTSNRLLWHTNTGGR